MKRFLSAFILILILSVLGLAYLEGLEVRNAEITTRSQDVVSGTTVYDLRYRLKSHFLGFGQDDAALPPADGIHALDIGLFVSIKKESELTILSLSTLPEEEMAFYEQRAQISLKGSDQLFSFVFDKSGLKEIAAPDEASPEVRSLMVSLAGDIWIDQGHSTHRVSLSEGFLTRERKNSVRDADVLDQEYSFTRMEGLSGHGGFSVSGNARYSFVGDAPLPSSVAISRVTNGYLNNLPLFSSTLSISLEPGKTRTLKKQLVAKSTTTFNSIQELVTSKQEEMIDQKLIEGQDFSVLLDEVITLDVGKDITDINETYSRLQAFLRLHPDLLSEILVQLEQLAAKDHRFGILTALLTTTGTSEAQEALIEAAEQLWEQEGKRNNLLRKLGFIENPTDQVKAFAFDVLDRLPQLEHSYIRALSALGSVAYHSQDPIYSNKVYQTLKRHMAIHPNNRRESIIAMSNMAYSGYLPDASEMAASDSSKTRLAGILLLRRFDQQRNPDVKGMLLTSVSSDNVQQNRYYAASFLRGSSFDEEDVQDVKMLIKKEVSPQVTMELVRSLGETHKPDAAKKVLLELYRDCSNKKVCSRIERTLRNI